MRAEMNGHADVCATAFLRTLFVAHRRSPLAGEVTSHGDTPLMLVQSRPTGRSWAFWRRCVALLFALALVVAAPSDALAADTQVSIVQPGDSLSLRYEPSSQSVSAGSTVTWTNNGSTAVTITSPDGLFDSETLQPGSSFSHQFETPGTFRYFCVPYPHMKGVIVVTP